MSTPVYNVANPANAIPAGYHSEEIPFRMSASQRRDIEQITTERPEPDSAAEDSVLLEWSVHLLKQDPGRLWGVIAVALVAAIAGIVFFKSIVFALAGCLLILSSAAEFLFPIRYRITRTKAFCSFGLTRYEIAWREVRRILQADEAVKLSPLPEPSRLDAFRGVLLRFAEDGRTGNRAQVMEVVDRLRVEARSRATAQAPQVSSGV